VFFDSLIGLELVIVINRVCSRLSYCKVLLSSLLVLAVLLLAYVFVGVAPASANGVLDMAVVRGTDSHLYWNSYNSGPSWGPSWVSLGGSTPSPPGICEAEGLGYVYVVVRGMDNGIYLRLWSSSVGWSSFWVSPPGGGRTIDTPACAYLNGIFVVVRGTNNELYWNYYNNVWSGWVDLHGKSASAPVLVSIPSLNRIDLVVQGTDNGIYHKFFPSPPGGVWSSSWDSPGGKTSSKPAAAFYFNHFPSSTDFNYLFLVVRGTDNNVYSSSFLIGGGWGVWVNLSGKTLYAPTLAYYANGCSPGTPSNCYSIDALAVRGTDNAVYHKTLTGYWDWSGSWDSPGGSITNSPALAYVPGSSAQFLLLVEGSSNKLYSNTVTGSTWGTWGSVGGATNSDPALVAIV
jgi:hypothetical protein